jgi:hypothetical protein
VTAGSAPAGEFAFATPADWFAVRLPRTESDADQLARDLAAAQPALADRRDELRAMLSGLTGSLAVRQAAAAYAAFPGGPAELPATLLVSVLPMGGSTLDQIGWEMPGTDHPSAPSTTKMFDLPAGRTMRMEQLIEPSATGDNRRPASVTVKYVTEVPGRDQVIALTFATSALTLVDQVRLVFHQIACSLLINPAGRVRPPARSGSPSHSDAAEAY